MDIAQLYLYTGTARGLYEKLGWREFWQEEYENLPVTAMSLAPGEGVSQTLTVGKPPGT